jgi:hypothetical protein
VPRAHSTVLAIKGPEQNAQWYVALFCRDHHSSRRHPSNPSLCCFPGWQVNQISLVENHAVGGTQSQPHDVAHIQIITVSSHCLGISHRDHTIESQAWSVPIFGYLGGIGHATGLDHQPVWRVLDTAQYVECGGESVDQAAADAAIGKRDLVVVGRNYQVLVDVDSPEIVDDDPDALSRFTENTIDQGGLTGTDIAVDDGDVDRVPLNDW